MSHVPLAPLAFAEPTTQDLIIDDFQKGATSGIPADRVNTAGGFQGTFAKRPSFATIHKIITDPATGEKALVIQYNKQGGWCGWYTLLNGANVTAHNAVSFWVRGEKGGERFDVGLSDRRMQDLGIDATIAGTIKTFLPGGVTTEWQRVLVPLSTVSSEIDMTQMGSLVFIFRYEGAGTMMVKDIRFVKDKEVAKQEAKEAPRAKRDPKRPRSLWVWNIDPMLNLRARQQLFDLCQRAAIERIFLYIGELDPDDPAQVHAMADFLKESHQRKVRVEALTGNPIWALEEHHGETLQWVKAFLDYNEKQPPDCRMDGVSLDIEPYLTSYWNEDREGIKKQFLALLEKIRQLVDQYPQPSFQVGLAVPFFYDKEEDGRFEEKILKYVDYLALMDYYDSPSAIIQNAKFHIDLANRMGKKVTIGVETQDLVRMKQGKRRNTFHEEGWDQMERVLARVRSEFADDPSLEGFAIHEYGAYRQLPRGRNVPTSERPAPPPSRLIAQWMAPPPALDGQLAEWNLTNPLVVQAKPNVVYGTGAWKGPADTSFKAYAVYDADTLYLALDVSDDTVLQEMRGADMWEHDHLELWIDADLQGDYNEAVNSADDFQFGFSPGNFKDKNPEIHLWVPEAEGIRVDACRIAATQTPTGYILEAAIPLKFLRDAQQAAGGQVTIPDRLDPSVKMGLMLDLSDCDEPNYPQKLIISSSTGRVWGDPTTFGVLEFGEER